MSVLPVVERLRGLAADPTSRAVIEQDPTMLAGLGSFLENSDPAVVAAALETMEHLAASPCAATFVPAVKKQMIYGAGVNKALAQRVFLKLQAAGKQKQQATATSGGGGGGAGAENAPANATATSAPIPAGKKEEEGSSSVLAAKKLGQISQTAASPAVDRSAALAQARKMAQTHSFDMEELTDDQRDEVEMKLIGVPGLISFTLDTEAHTLTLRSNETDADGLKRKLREQYDIPIAEDGNVEAIPDYLPEDDTSGKGKQGGWGSWLVSFGDTQPQKKNQASSWAPWTSSIKTVGQGLGVL